MKKIMKLTSSGILILLLCYGPCSLANFEQAMKNYESGKYELAYKEFDYLAKIGYPGAQFNLGVMFYQGQYVSKDQIEGYAWLALAGSSGDKEWQEVANKVYASFSETNQIAADKKRSELESQFSQAALSKALEPEYTNIVDTNNNLKVIKKVRPKYPRDMNLNGVIGWVDVIYSVAKDGSTRNHTIAASSNSGFDRATINAIKQWQYKPLVVDGKPVESYGQRMRFTYSFDDVSFDEDALNKYIAELREKANAGLTQDKYRYASFLSGLSSMDNVPVDIENYNEWYFKAASENFSPAEFHLGRNVLYGSLCKVDSYKSLAWLQRSANSNLTEAQYLIAIEKLNGARFEKDIPGAMLWLSRAAEAGSNIARLKLAWIWSTASSEENFKPEQAMNLLSMVPKGHRDELTYNEVAAAVYASNNSFSKAKKYQNKAIRVASSLDLPLAEHKSKLQTYEKKRRWTESI